MFEGGAASVIAPGMPLIGTLRVGAFSHDWRSGFAAERPGKGTAAEVGIF